MTNKNTYIEPKLKVVRFKVEEGFAASPLRVISNDDTPVDGATETYSRTTFEGWGTSTSSEE
jgi:hypothetical protein